MNVCLRVFHTALIHTERNLLCQTCVSQHPYPEEGIQRSVLHELCDDEDGAAPRQDALQPDHVGVVKLAHDRGFCEEVSSLALSVAGFQGLNCHDHLPAAGLLEASTANLTEFTWAKRICGGGGGGE